MKRVWLVAFCLATSFGVNAQTNSCSQYEQLQRTSLPGCLLTSQPGNPTWATMPANAVCCNNGLAGQSCLAKTSSCGAPPNASSETCIACNQGRTAQAAHPIDLATGNTYVTQSDIAIPGLGGGLPLSRVWNSMLPSIQRSYSNMFGSGWRSTYEERLVFGNSDGYVKYLRSDGSVFSFGVSNMASPITYRATAPASDISTTISQGTPNWTCLRRAETGRR